MMNDRGGEMSIDKVEGDSGTYEVDIVTMWQR